MVLLVSLIKDDPYRYSPQGMFVVARFAGYATHKRLTNERAALVARTPHQQQRLCSLSIYFSVSADSGGRDES
jgi:hypothetical protein